VPHCGDCPGHAVHRVKSEGFWETLEAITTTPGFGTFQSPDEPGVPERPLVRVACRHGRHRSRMAARSAAVWTGGTYFGHYTDRQDDQGCRWDCDEVTDEQYAVQLQRALLRQQPCPQLWHAPWTWDDMLD